MSFLSNLIKWKVVYGDPIIVSGMDSGALISQAVLSPSTTKSTLTLSQPAKGLRIVATGLNPTATTAPMLSYLCFDAPNDATRDSWLTDTIAAPRVAIRMNGQAIEIDFNGDTVSTIGYVMNGTDATARIHVEAIV